MDAFLTDECLFHKWPSSLFCPSEPSRLQDVHTICWANYLSLFLTAITTTSVTYSTNSSRSIHTVHSIEYTILGPCSIISPLFSTANITETGRIERLGTGWHVPAEVVVFAFTPHAPSFFYLGASMCMPGFWGREGCLGMDKEKVRTHWSRVLFTVSLSFIFGGMSPSKDRKSVV